MEKFFEYKKENKKYFPKLKVDICKYEQVKIVDKIKQLINEFNNFDCILSNFYIDRL
jgi:plasmid rolling circle replication initiator protein Rep